MERVADQLVADSAANLDKKKLLFMIDFDRNSDWGWNAVVPPRNRRKRNGIRT
jgi:hypothetical protein